MVDRGGLNYPIRVRDEFSKTTKLFRSEIAKSKKELRDFQKTAQGNRSAASDAKARAGGVREETKAARENTKENKKRLKPLTDLERFEKKRQRTLRDLRDQVRLLGDEEVRAARKARQSAAEAEAASRNAEKIAARVAKQREREARAALKVAQAKSVEFQATKRLEAAEFRRLVTLKQIEKLRASSLASFQSGNISQGIRQLKQSRDLTRSLGRQNNAVKKLFFSFRRLVGVLALFTLARKGLQIFNQLVRSGVKFNDTVQSAQLGIAGLVVTLGDVRNAQGLSVDATEQLSIALGVAREQTALLRQDSLKTVATFEQLLDTFQVSVGPGLAAGLDLDEVRQLTVDISQAASALGVPQNQLAEEVRSLLSGTIQARTTRIATALGISNEDVRLLKETGELFDFLEEKFAGFAEAAELQARTTFAGITTLIRGLVQEVLGNAARPLFEELIDLGNDLFDNFLSIRDAAGNIRPSPEVVAAFQQVFDALKRAVESFRELGEGNGANALESTMGAVAIIIDGIAGLVEGMVSTFLLIADVVKSIGQELNFTSGSVGTAASAAAKWAFFLNAGLTTLLVASPIVKRMTGNFAIWVAALTVVAAGFQFIFGKIFGLNVTIGDTVQLIAVSMVGAWLSVGSVIQEVSVGIVTFMANALDKVITAAKNKASSALVFISSLFGDDKGAQIAAKARLDRELASDNRIAARKKAAARDIAEIELRAAATKKGIEEEIAGIIGRRAGKNAQGEGFLPGFDPKKAAEDAAAAANSFVSTTNRSVGDLGESLGKVNTEIEKARLLFDQARASSGAGGVGGQIEGEFDKQQVALADRLRKIKTDLLRVDKEIERLSALGPEAAGALNSALRDQELLQVAIANAAGQSLELASIQAATIATQVLPALREQSTLLVAEVAAERAKTIAIQAGVSDRQLALVAARSAVDLAHQELQATQRKNKLENQALISSARQLDPGVEQDAIKRVIAQKFKQQRLEGEILALRIMQLEQAQKEADLIANGDILQGLGRGLTDIAENFGNAFQAGIDIATAALMGFTQFASQSIVDAFDPTKDSASIKENFARLLQEIAQLILQKFIELQIAKALIALGFGADDPSQSPEKIAAATAARVAAEAAVGTAKVTAETALGAARLISETTVGAARIATETTIAAIRLANAIAIAAVSGGGGGVPFSDGGPVGSFAQGGFVPEHLSRRAQGLAGGGLPRPSHIPASDTVPAWLTPGEFVMNRSATSSFLPMLEAMNGGNMGVTGSASAEAAGPSTGMASGGTVTDQIARAQGQRGGGGGGATTVVVPAVVASEREMDALTTGGKNAMLAFMRENAGNINSLLDRSNRQR